MNGPCRRGVLLTAIAALARPRVGGARSAASPAIRVLLPAGIERTAWHDHISPALAAAAIPSILRPLGEGTPPQYGWDLALLDGAALQAGAIAGRLAALDTAPATLRQRGGYGLPIAYTSTVLGWNERRISGPLSWRDFGDVARRPGRRGLPRGPRMTLEIALLADGVQPAETYSTLRRPDGVDRALRKLDQLRPYLVWWSSPADAVRLLDGGGAMMVAAPAQAVQLANRRPGTVLATSAEPGMVSPQFLAVAARAANPAQAWRAAAIAATNPNATSFATEAALASATGGTPPGQVVDEAFWQENGANLERRFAGWLAQ